VDDVSSSTLGWLMYLCIISGLLLFFLRFFIFAAKLIKKKELSIKTLCKSKFVPNSDVARYGL
jgi:hypothetical protein